jgi:hypothetical protein
VTVTLLNPPPSPCAVNPDGPGCKVSPPSLPDTGGNGPQPPAVPSTCGLAVAVAPKLPRTGPACETSFGLLVAASSILMGALLAYVGRRRRWTSGR